MRYTKYNYKKRKNNDVWKMILSFVAMSVFVIIVGVFLANVIIYFLPANDANENLLDTNTKQKVSENVEANNESENNEVISNTEGDNSTETNSNNLISSFTIVQCGYFSNNDNANVILSKISNEYNAFIFNDGDKFKVLAGVYNSGNADDVMNKLTAAGIENAKITINLSLSDSVQNQVAAICDGYLKLINTSLDNDVKFVSTDDFKGWVSNLESIENGDKIDVLNNLKQHISECASEIKKEDVVKEMQFIYTILINFN